MAGGNKLMAGLATGAIIGAVALLLLSPKTGKETRHIVATRAGGLRHKAGGYVGALRQKAGAVSGARPVDGSSDHHGSIAG